MGYLHCLIIKDCEDATMDKEPDFSNSSTKSFYSKTESSDSFKKSTDSNFNDQTKTKAQQIEPESKAQSDQEKEKKEAVKEVKVEENLIIEPQSESFKKLVNELKNLSAAEKAIIEKYRALAPHSENGIKLTKGVQYKDTKGNIAKFNFSIAFPKEGGVFALDEFIGRGGYGEVRSVVDVLNPKDLVVVKVYRKFPDKKNIEAMQEFVDKEQLNPNQSEYVARYKRAIDRRKPLGAYFQANIKNVEREKRVLKELSDYKGSVETKYKILVFQKKKPGKTLSDILEDKFKSLKSNPIKKGYPDENDNLQYTRIAIGVCEALSELHGKNIIHRDLKPDNIVYNPNENPPYGKARFIDLGTRVNLNQAKPYAQGAKSGIYGTNSAGEVRFYASPKKYVGTQSFMAPEVVQIKDKQKDMSTYKGMYSKSSDKYALGKTIELIFLFNFHYAKNNPNYEGLDPRIKTLRDQLMDPAVKNRPALDEVLKVLKAVEADLVKKPQKKPIL